jgi:hypothetical protein
MKGWEIQYNITVFPLCKKKKKDRLRKVEITSNYRVASMKDMTQHCISDANIDGFSLIACHFSTIIF